MKYSNFKRNHVILPGREKALEKFLNQDYNGRKYKLKNGLSSHSEDALTWSCFEVLSSFPLEKKISAINELMEDSNPGKEEPLCRIGNLKENKIQIHVGKQYTGSIPKEKTEVDASIELPDKLIFFEAKLYSPMSMADLPKKPHDQIARKLRIGIDSALRDRKEFFFIFLDIAPLEKMIMRKSKSEALSPAIGFHDKWKSAWLFSYYKYGRNGSLKPLQKALDGIKAPSVQSVADNMGWLTWSDLFKDILRGIYSK